MQTSKSEQPRFGCLTAESDDKDDQGDESDESDKAVEESARKKLHNMKVNKTGNSMTDWRIP